MEAPVHYAQAPEYIFGLYPDCIGSKGTEGISGDWGFLKSAMIVRSTKYQVQRSKSQEIRPIADRN